MNSKTGHSIKNRKYANDEFMTPPELAKSLIGLVPLEKDDWVLDAARGDGAFYNNYPVFCQRTWAGLDRGRDFLNTELWVEWIVTNPPYSDLDAWFKKAAEVSTKGFAYLLGFTNITPRRIEMANKAGFGLTRIHLCKVYHWYGISAFCVFEKGYTKSTIEFTYDRTVWR